jgi:hypothetical protein
MSVQVAEPPGARAPTQLWFVGLAVAGSAGGPDISLLTAPYQVRRRMYPGSSLLTGQRLNTTDLDADSGAPHTAVLHLAAPSFDVERNLHSLARLTT